MLKRGQGQSWSLDIILAVVVFMLIIAIFYALLNTNAKTAKPQELEREASTLANVLDASTGVADSRVAVINKGTLDKTKMESLYNENYQSIKSQFGLKGEFCIYVIDQNGKLVTIDDKTGFGNGDFLINGQPCGAVLS